jgi:DNA-binding MarR family transcriptional regulator
MLQSPVVLWLRFARVYHRLDHQLTAQLRARDLSLAQFDTLTQVGASEGLTQQELADRLLVTKGNICQLLDRMEQTGLLARRQDGRANRVYVTDDGRQLLHEVMPEHEALIASLFAPLTRDEQRQMRRLLRALDHRLVEEKDKA